MIRRLLVNTKDQQYKLPIQNIGNQVNPRRPSRAGRHTAELDDNVLTLSLFVERRKTTRFDLSFQEALERRNSMYTHTLYLNLTYNVRKFDLQYLIHDARGIAFLRPINLKKAYVHSEGKFTEQGFSRKCLDLPKRIDGYTFKMNCFYGTELRNPAFMIGLEYDVMRVQNGNNFILKDDQFVHLLDLGNLSSSTCRDVVFILDVLDGIRQTVQQDILAAMISILDEMGSDDRVDFITTGQSPQTLNKMGSVFKARDHELKRELQDFVLKSFLRSKRTGGGNIAGAFKSAKLKFAQVNSHFRSCVPLIVIISCGSSLDERTDKVKILEEVGSENTDNFPIFSLVLGRFSHFTFFERLSSENFGFVTTINNTGDVKSQITKHYGEIARTAAINVTILYPPYIKMTTQRKFPFALNGTEILICGRFKPNRSANLFQFHVKYKNGRGDRYDSKTLFDTGNFHRDTTAETLNMLCIHVLIKDWFANYHRLTVEKRQELGNILRATIAQEQLLIPSLTKSRLVRARSKRLDGLHFSHDDSVVMAKLSIGAPGDNATNTTPLQDPKQPANGNRKQSLVENRTQLRNNRMKRRESDRQPREIRRQPRKNGRQPRKNGKQPRKNRRQPRKNGRQSRKNGRQPKGNGRQSRKNGRQPRKKGRQPRKNGRQTKKNGRQPRKNRRQRRRWRPEPCNDLKSIRRVVLSVIAMSVPEEDPEIQSKRGICILPREWTCDLYINLVEYTNGTGVFLSQDSRKIKDRKGTAVHPLSLYVRENRPGSKPSGGHREKQSNHTIIFLSGENKWTSASQDPRHVIKKPSLDEMIISTPSLTITLKRVCKRRVMSISIHISPGRSFDLTKLTGGLLANFINMEKRKVERYKKNTAKKMCERNGMSSSLIAVRVWMETVRFVRDSCKRIV